MLMSQCEVPHAHDRDH